jgi:hypothetical protein
MKRTARIYLWRVLACFLTFFMVGDFIVYMTVKTSRVMWIVVQFPFLICWKFGLVAASRILHKVPLENLETLESTNSPRFGNSVPRKMPMQVMQTESTLPDTENEVNPPFHSGENLHEVVNKMRSENENDEESTQVLPANSSLFLNESECSPTQSPNPSCSRNKLKYNSIHTETSL